jgi:hypothetical protein
MVRVSRESCNIPTKAITRTQVGLRVAPLPHVTRSKSPRCCEEHHRGDVDKPVAEADDCKDAQISGFFER